MTLKEKYTFTFILLILLLIALTTIIRYANTQKSDEILFEDLSIEDLVDNVNKDISIKKTHTIAEIKKITEPSIYVDVRDPLLYKQAHVRGSIPLSQLNRHLQNTQEQIIVIISQSNNTTIDRASLVAKLKENYTVYIFEGTLDELQASGSVIIKDSSLSSFTDLAKVSFIEPRDAFAQIKNTKNDITIIDTRRSGNYKKSHIAGAVNIPIADLEFRYREIPRTNDIYIYGTDANQSFKSGAILSDLGYTNTKTINGGYNAWEEYNYPLIAPE